MTLAELGEEGLIDRLRRLGLARPPGVVVGIGDDAAVFRVAPGFVSVASTDLLVEGVDFRREWTDAFDLGGKAAEVNMSDLAAMGAQPREALLGLALAGATEVEFFDRMVEGFRAALAACEANLVGGDLSRTDGPMVLAVTVFGEAPEGGVVYRRGACAGDILCVTGELGAAAAGLIAAEHPTAVAAGPARDGFLRALRRPRAHVAEGIFLAQSGAARAMIDLSDGLARDLGHLTAASGVGAAVDAAALPLSDALAANAPALGTSALELALHGGEDYCLLVALDPARAAVARAGFAGRFGRELSVIGVAESAPGLRLRRGGQVAALAPRGFDHFGASA